MKFKKLIVFLGIILLLTATILTGCHQNNTVVQLVSYELPVNNGQQTSAGLIGVPVGDYCPVVFILHGAYFLEGDSFTPYYQGFEYLVQELADNGYLAISLDLNNAFTGDSQEGSEYDRVKKIFQINYEQLVLANKGGKAFNCDLKEKADLSKINLIGHSRGGDQITHLAADADFKQICFQSALKIAAAGNDALRENYVDIPTGLIYSQYDEDILDLNSANYYYYAYENDLARRTPIISAFLYGANHAAYNTLVQQNGLQDYGNNVTYLSPEEQRTFTVKFALDFLAVNNRGANLFQIFNNGTSEKYGIDFMLSLHHPQGERILMPDQYMQGIIADKVAVQYVISSSNEIKNTAQAFNPPGTEEYLPLYKISWEKQQGSVLIPFDGMFYNLNKDKFLALYWGLDSSDPKNVAETATACNLILTDANGQRVVLPYSSIVNATLKYQHGQVSEAFGNKWQAFTPLGTELIDLNTLSDQLMLDNLVSLEIVPTCSTGAIMLGGINVYPK